MPREPFLHIIPALDLPVAPALGTISAGYGKQEAAEYATKAKGRSAQCKNATKHNFVAIDWLLDEPYCNCDDNTCN
jgi:hypothetical protein